MFEVHMLENFLWKSSTIVKLEVYTSSPLKNQLVRRNFEAFILKVTINAGIIISYRVFVGLWRENRLSK